MRNSYLRQFFISRGVRILPPADVNYICEVMKIYGVCGSSDMSEIYKSFNGFDEDYDEISMLSVWSLEKVAESHMEYKNKGLVPFADFSFMSEVYCFSSHLGNNFIWSELEQGWLPISVGEFFINWSQGGYDDGVGILSAP